MIFGLSHASLQFPAFRLVGESASKNLEHVTISGCFLVDSMDVFTKVPMRLFCRSRKT